MKTLYEEIRDSLYSVRNFAELRRIAVWFHAYAKSAHHLGDTDRISIQLGIAYVFTNLSVCKYRFDEELEALDQGLVAPSFFTSGAEVKPRDVPDTNQINFSED